jgi:DNA sulfur modification protein DndD
LEKEYENERDNLLSKETQGNQLVQDKNDILKEIDNFNIENGDFQNDLKDIQGRIVKLENQLSENEEIKVKIEEKKAIREKIKQLKDERDKFEAEKTRIFRENGTMILGTVLANELKPSVMNLLTEPSAVTPSHEFLDFLLDQVNCVCGSVMDEEKKENIKHSMQQFAQQDLEYKRANERKKWIQMLDKYPQHGANARLRYDEACKAKVRVNREINELEEREITVRSEVGNYNESTVQTIADEIARLEARQKEIERKIIRNTTLVEERQVKLNQLENKIAKLNVSKEKEDAEGRLAFARKVADALSEYQDTLIASKREEVESQSSHVFLQLTNKRNKYKSLKLNPSYQLLLEHSDGSLFEIERGRSLNPSTGQSKIISLSYIAGINKSTNAVAPVVIDNPVGLFSEEHRERVVKYLPHFGKQVMFMVTGADLGEQYRDMISPYVNRAYYLEDRADLTWNKTQIARVEEL